MIEYVSGDHLNISGNTIELVTDTIHMISEIYEVIKQKDEDLAYEYKKDVNHMLYAAFMSKEELNNEAQKQRKEFKRRIEDMLETIQNALDNKDIRSADFNSDDEFEKWFHSNTNDEEE